MSASDSTGQGILLGQTGSPPGLLAMRVDFAHAHGSRLLVYGWIVGLAESVASAVIEVGSVVVDVLTDAVRVRRVDVTQNFRDAGVSSDEHGYLALVDLPEIPTTVQALKVRVHLHSGYGAESEWPVIRDEAIAVATLRAHERVLRPLIPRLSAAQRQVLAGFGSRPPLSLRSDDLRSGPPDGAFALPVQIQLCSVLRGGMLVVGGVLPRPVIEVTALTLVWDELRIDLLDSLIKVNELGESVVDLTGHGELAYLPSGFLFACVIPGGSLPAGRVLTVQFSCAQGSASARQTVRADPLEAQAYFTAHLASVDPNARLELCERMTGLLPELGESAALTELVSRQTTVAIADLPAHLSITAGPSPVQIHIERTIRIADVGIFVVGWFNADPQARVRVICHAESGDFNVSAHWVRWARADVEEHLAKLALEVPDDPGFFCFIPLKPGKRPHYFLVGSKPGRVWRIQIPQPPAESLNQALRGVLAAVDPNRGDLRRLLDQHVGRAVGALWATHVPSRHRASVERFGPQHDAPSVSVVVPLFGRHDFADCQLALFADDPDFAAVELIYVVDDPSIVQGFRRECQDLHAFYGIPFTLAFPGDNLGFAGATNFGATLARAPYLLLLNSDVMPKEPGWLGRLLAIYRSLPDVGVLGAKLLYEDGTVQHAGMESRRHEHWQNLWINDHPYKGMSPHGLTGILEAESVTAACALVETGLYRALGGLSEDYIIGDFEDSDFCHRVRTHGRRNRVALDVVLYHLERQSQALAGDNNWRTAVTIYNCWLHNRRWGAALDGGLA